MKFSFDNFAKEGLHEECGVFGIFSDGTINPAYACYNGLLALQHRGQESCGIAVSDEGVIDYHKDMGLVTEVFNNKILDSLNGQMAGAGVRDCGRFCAGKCTTACYALCKGYAFNCP